MNVVADLRLSPLVISPFSQDRYGAPKTTTAIMGAMWTPSLTQGDLTLAGGFCGVLLHVCPMHRHYFRDRQVQKLCQRQQLLSCPCMLFVNIQMGVSILASTWSNVKCMILNNQQSKELIKIYLSGQRFIYDDVYSSKYNLAILEIETESLKSAEGEVEYFSSFFPATKQRYLTGLSREQAPLEFEVEIVSESGFCIEVEREIKRWLFNSPTFKKLYIDPEDDREAEFINGEVKRQYLECIFTNPHKLEYAEGTVGWRCTCLCSSSMAIQEDVTITYTDFTEDITINVDTDIDDYVYPYLVIEVDNSTNDISIINKTDNNRAMTIQNPTATLVLYTDCAMGSIITSANVSYYDHIANQRFLRLLPGDNILSVSDNVSSIKFTWQNSRWMT